MVKLLEAHFFNFLKKWEESVVGLRVYKKKSLVLSTSLVHLKKSSDAARPRQRVARMLRILARVARSAARPRNKPPRYVVILGFGGDTESAIFLQNLDLPTPTLLVVW